MLKHSVQPLYTISENGLPCHPGSPLTAAALHARDDRLFNMEREGLRVRMIVGFSGKEYRVSGLEGIPPRWTLHQVLNSHWVEQGENKKWDVWVSPDTRPDTIILNNNGPGEALKFKAKMYPDLFIGAYGDTEVQWIRTQEGAGSDTSMPRLVSSTDTSCVDESSVDPDPIRPPTPPMRD